MFVEMEKVIQARTSLANNLQVYRYLFKVKFYILFYILHD